MCERERERVINETEGEGREREREDREIPCVSVYDPNATKVCPKMN